MILKKIGEWFKWLFPTTIFILLVYFSMEYPIIRVFLILFVAGFVISICYLYINDDDKGK